MTETTEKARVCVIGGGAAGMMAAIHAAYLGASVTLFERNHRLGVKLRITGKGRCNLTNDCDRDTFLANVPRNPRFLYAALARFSPEDCKSFFEMLGVPLKVERGRRVFPVSDRAHDVADALARHAEEVGVKVITARVQRLLTRETGDKKEICGLLAGGQAFPADAVILATGGRSYPRTGSDGDGYTLAGRLGHTVTPLSPSLVPLAAEGNLCAAMQGLALRNVTLSIVDTANGKEVFSEFGELLFTHFGLSGPLVLSASAHLEGMAAGRYTAVIDLKPALDEKALDARLLSDFARFANKDFLNALGDLLPQKMIGPIVSLSGIDGRRKVHDLTREERRRLVLLLKGLEIPIRGFRPIDEAIVTRGGIAVKEIDPKTMASKRVSGLYFAGEIIDVDAYTGGYNLQIAFATAVLAGEHAGEFASGRE